MSDTATVERPPADAYDLAESISLAEALSGDSIFDEDGCVPIHIIRPGIGKGRGRHLYEADMLAENAGKFVGWKMYIDHESPEARKAAGGLPRKTRDLGGRIVEATWDASVPADPVRGYGQGAVVGRAKPTRFIRELIEDDPEILEASISASATGVRPVMRGGQRVWLVEGINDKGSVDWVTEAGAGGRVAALLEAYAETDNADADALLETLSDDDLREYLANNRAAVLAEADGETDNEGGADMADITPEQLQEALAESPDVLVAALAQSAEVQVFVTTLVEAKLDEERDEIRAEAKADAERALELRDLKDSAHEIIKESKLPESWQADLLDRFSLAEGKPSTDLDVVDEVDDDGAVVKSSHEILREAVESAVERDRERLSEAKPTRVRGQGAKPTTEKAEELREGEEPKKPEQEKGEPRLYETFLQEAGVDPEKTYAK